MDERSRSWPLTGLSYFISHPGLWLRPLLGSIAVLASLLVVFLFVFWLFLPEAEGWWLWLWELLQATGAALIAVLLAWFLIMPLIMGFAFEHLVVAVYKRHAVDRAGETMVQSLLSTGSVLMRTLHWRIMWPLCSLICWFIPILSPFGPVISHLGIAHVAAIDACDLALAVRGVRGRERVAMMRKQHGALFSGAMVATAIGIALGITVIGWILFLPMMFTGAAIWVAHWQVDPDRTAVEQESADTTEQDEQTPSS